MSERDDELEARLTSAGEKWRTGVPSVSVDSARLKHGRRRSGLIAAAAVLIAIAVPVALAASHHDKKADPKPTQRILTPARNVPLSADEVDLALAIAKDKQAGVKGTFVGALVAPVILDEPIMNDDCPLTRLLRIRLVWEDDAGFDHGGIAIGPGATPDGPLKGFLLFVDPATKKVCSHGAQYRSIGARDEEVLLYGERPVDPTGDFRVFGADRVRFPAANGKKGYADKTVLNALGVTYLPRSTEEALRMQQFRETLTWRVVRIGIYNADGSKKLGDQYIGNTGPSAYRTPRLTTPPLG